MSDHNIVGISESEQMYLITITRLIEDGHPEPVPISVIAKVMSVLPVSVNQMVRKLEGEGLLHYFPYKGVELTPQGREIAFRTLRNRRLWEVFLVEHLEVSLEDADAMACSLEHITPDDIAQRLASFLDDPKSSPGGQPIPEVDSGQILHNWIPLTQLKVGMQSLITQIKAPEAVVRFLNKEGINPGSIVRLKAVDTSGSMLVEVDMGLVELSADIARSIYISRPNLNQPME